MRIGWLIVAITLLGAGGCAPRARLLVLRPAELDLPGVARIAVVDFQGEGESGKIARAALLAQLSENRHFALVDQAELARVQPAAFQADGTDESLAVQAARDLGVDAVLAGQVVSYNVDDQVQQDHHIAIGGGGAAKSSGSKAGGFGIGFDTNTLHQREASVSLAFKLIDARSGEVLAARQASHTFQGRIVNGQGEMPGREKVLNDLLAHCSRDVVAMIAPHYVPVEVVLARQYWGNGLSDLRHGNDLAKRGDWTAAEAAWSAALERNPRNHAAHHNLALASEVKGDYAAARKHLDQAIEAYAASLYHETRTRIAISERDYAAARSQSLARLPPSVPTNTLQPGPVVLPTSSATVSPAGYYTPLPGDDITRLPPPAPEAR